MTEDRCTRDGCCMGALQAGGHTRAQGVYMNLLTRRPGMRKADHHTLPAAELVLYRCRDRGHLAGIVYDTYAGPLFVSAASVGSPDVREAVLAGKASAPAGLRGKMPADPAPRLPQLDEPQSDEPYPLQCRCGPRPSRTRAQVIADTPTGTEKQPRVIPV